MAMTDRQKGLMDELMAELSSADGGVMSGSFINGIKGIMDGLKGQGIGSTTQGIDTPADREFLANTVGQGAVVVPPEANTDVMFTPAQREFIDSLPEPIRLRVEEHRAPLPPLKFQELINGMMEGVIPEGAVWENAGANLGANAGFQQYNTGTAIPNLGFAGYPQG